MEQNLIFPYRCEKCSSNSPTFNWRLILNMSMADCTDNQWINCFQETAESMLGMSSEDLGNLFVNDRAQYDSVFSAATFKRWIIRVRFVIFVILSKLISRKAACPSKLLQIAFKFFLLSKISQFF